MRRKRYCAGATTDKTATRVDNDGREHATTRIRGNRTTRFVRYRTTNYVRINDKKRKRIVRYESLEENNDYRFLSGKLRARHAVYARW